LGFGGGVLAVVDAVSKIGASLEEKDAGALPTFFDFPAEQRMHLRTSNVIESATLRLRRRAATRFRFKQLIQGLRSRTECALRRSRFGHSRNAIPHSRPSGWVGLGSFT
jgi:transposase-like protein